MKHQIEMCATWLAARFQSAGASFDSEVLQWPGGGFIAIFLWLYATVAVACGRHEQVARKTVVFGGLASTR
jgi:hypothetical protein